MERLLMVMEAQNLLREDSRSLDIYICLLGEKVNREGMRWLNLLRDHKWRVDRDYQQRSIKAQMREANRQKAKFVLILGENELEKNCFAVKNMSDGKQTEINFADIITYLKPRL
jgi:histidyl-tRNA synthetase